MAMERSVVLLAAVMLGACTVQSAGKSADASGAEPVSPMPAAGECNADKAQSAIGQAYTDKLAEELRKTTGARVIRRIEPGQMVTMDFRDDRLNIELDGSGKIARVRCG